MVQTNGVLVNKWIYKLARIFGFWSFQIDFKHKKTLNALQPETFDQLRAAAAIVVYLMCIYIQLSTIGHLIASKYSIIELVLRMTPTISGAIISLLTVALNYVHRNIVRNVLLIFQYFDEKVNWALKCSELEILIRIYILD